MKDKYRSITFLFSSSLLQDPSTSHLTPPFTSTAPNHYKMSDFSPPETPTSISCNFTMPSSSYSWKADKVDDEVDGCISSIFSQLESQNRGTRSMLIFPDREERNLLLHGLKEQFHDYLTGSKPPSFFDRLSLGRRPAKSTAKCSVNKVLKYSMKATYDADTKTLKANLGIKWRLPNLRFEQTTTPYLVHCRVEDLSEAGVSSGGGTTLITESGLD